MAFVVVWGPLRCYWPSDGRFSNFDRVAPKVNDGPACVENADLHDVEKSDWKSVLLSTRLNCSSSVDIASWWPLVFSWVNGVHDVRDVRPVVVQWAFYFSETWRRRPVELSMAWVVWPSSLAQELPAKHVIVWRQYLVIMRSAAFWVRVSFKSAFEFVCFESTTNRISGRILQFEYTYCLVHSFLCSHSPFHCLGGVYSGFHLCSCHLGQPLWGKLKLWTSWVMRGDLFSVYVVSHLADHSSNVMT